MKTVGDTLDVQSKWALFLRVWRQAKHHVRKVPVNDSAELESRLTAAIEQVVQDMTAAAASRWNHVPRRSKDTDYNVMCSNALRTILFHSHVAYYADDSIEALLTRIWTNKSKVHKYLTRQ